jgi:threonine/homoserine/homoserine lactone efflux protein
VFDGTTVILFLIATLTLNLTPGPDVFFVLANSGRHGTRGGILASLGVAGGIVVHTLLSALGVAALIATNRWAFDAMRMLGAVYLIWLGIEAWRNTARAVGAAAPTDWLILRRGFVTNVLNPKVALFFLAFLPQFTDPGRDDVVWQLLALGGLFIVCGTLVNVGYAMIGGWLSDLLRREPRWQRTLDRVAGSILVALGVRLLWPQRTL